MKKKVVIIIPIYKKNLNDFERVSLMQVKLVLGNYPIVFVAPVSLDFDYGENTRDFPVETFSDKYFKNTKTYSEMLLSPMFYERFANYEYMLIYQLDALVFSDRLEEFCDLGYDYIGAPINKGNWRNYHVGNGGLSLRKISSALELLKHRDIIMEGNPLKEIFWEGEDNFFAYCGRQKEIEFSVPSVFLAARFSSQSDVGHGLRSLSKHGLPFGTHHWPDWNYQVWKPIVERYGYELPDVADIQYHDTLENDRKERIESFIRHYLRRHVDEKADIIKTTGIDRSKSCVIWGAGIFGKRCLKLLDFLSVYVAYFCDKNAEELVQCSGVEVKPPMKDNLIGKTVIIAVKNRETICEIENHLKEIGLQKGTDYFIYTEMARRMEEYIKERVGDIPGITVPLQIENDSNKFMEIRNNG